MPRSYKPLKNISRRDFCQGLLIGTALASSPLQAAVRTAGQDKPYYPPALTGLRGTHDGAFEVAHALAREGEEWARPTKQTDEDYDLVVVGGGISGLTAAYLYREQAGADARILILENHDDVGGHAKRNEFTIGRKTLIGYGGSQSIDTPSSYSTEAKALLAKLGIKPKRFETYYDQQYFADRKLTSGLFLNKKAFGETRLLAKDQIFNWADDTVGGALDENYLQQLPFTEAEKKNLNNLLTATDDPFPGESKEEVEAYLRSTSYADYVKEKFNLLPRVLKLVDERLDGYWGVGQDAQSAMESLQYGMPGFQGLRHSFASDNPHDAVEEPYIFHFPDGNASIARLLVSRLCPDALYAPSMEAVVTAKLDYRKLDQPNANTRIRLNSTAVHVANQNDSVDITYVKSGTAHRVRTKHAVMACYNMIIPHLCPEISDAQAEALAYQVKVPMAYVNVALRNWRAFAKAGIHSANCPHAFFSSVSMDFPVSMGGYTYPENPAEPVVLHLPYHPKEMYQGLSARDQFRIGRYRMLEMTFEDYEQEVVTQLTEMLAPYGFKAERDISAITVNRWPHGYAYEYMHLWDETWPEGEAPHEQARKPVGNIHIANSDSEAFAYVDGAINAAYRALAEITG